MERNRCFQSGKHLSDTRDGMHCLSEERRWPILSISMPRTACGWNALMTDTSYTWGGSGDIQHAQRKLVLDLSPFRAPGWRVSHPRRQPTSALSHPLDQECLSALSFSLAQIQHPARQQGTGPMRGHPAPQWKLEIPFPYYIQHHMPLGRCHLDHKKHAFFPWTSVFKKSHLGKMQIIAL